MDLDKPKTEVEAQAEHSEILDLSFDELSYGPPGIRGVFSSGYVVFCCSFAAIGGVLFGYDQGVISVTLTMPFFEERFYEISSGFYQGLMTAMITLGAFVGSLNVGWMADLLSRKVTIMVAVLVFLAGSILQTAAINYAMLTVGRFIGGLGIGTLSTVVPLYISEISAPEIRGVMLVLEQLSIVLGIILAYYISYGTRDIPNHWSWQLPFLLQMVPAVVLGLGAFFLPRSPRWLVQKGRDDDALNNLAKLRRLSTEDRRVRREWVDIIAESRFQKEKLAERHPLLTGDNPTVWKRAKLEVMTWADVFRKGCIKRTHVGMGVTFFQQFMGINALIYYSPTLFKTMGLDIDMQLIMSGVLNVMQLVGVLSSLFILDLPSVGRVRALLVGAAIMCVSHVIIAALVATFSYDWPSHTTPGWVSVAFLLVYMVAFGASWGPVPWAMPSEIFPSSLRAKGVGISTACNWITNFIIGLITPPLIESTGFGAYVFFAVFCGLAFIWTWFIVPETMGRTLEQMDRVFGDRDSSSEVLRKNEIFGVVMREMSGRDLPVGSGISKLTDSVI